MEYVRKSTSARRLLDPKRQVYDLVLLNDGTSHRAICDILIQQYKLAKDFGDLRWIDTVRKECTTVGWRTFIHLRPSSAVSSTASPKMCRDIRL